MPRPPATRGGSDSLTIPPAATRILIAWGTYFVVATVVAMVLNRVEGWTVGRFFATWIGLEVLWIPIVTVGIAVVLIWRRIGSADRPNSS